MRRLRQRPAPAKRRTLPGTAATWDVAASAGSLKAETSTRNRSACAASKALAANQGLYNGFLVAGLVWGLLEDSVDLKVFFLACVVVALWDLGGRSLRFQVDWAGAKDDGTLPGAWEEAARAHFEALRSAGVLSAFAQHALGRLQPAAASAGEGNFLRSQDLRFGRSSAFDLTTGAVAIEESLQLERLRGTGRNRGLPADVPLASVEGVTIRSHPWEEMLKGKRPEPHPIERFGCTF